jgi:hypothetical protein
MSISSITSSSAASQLAYISKNDSGSTDATRQVPPPPPEGGGGFISAIADALKSIGVSASSGESRESSDGSNAAHALGSFLEELMDALHAQGTEESAAPPYGEPPQGGPGSGGGPGKLAEDLQSLIAKLGSSAADADATTGAEESSGTTGALETSFSNLLSAMGADSSDASSQLGSFLQALAGGMPQARSSGNLINTRA